MENCVERVIQAEPFFHDGDEGISGHGGPDLGFDCVGGCSIEALDPQMLFDPFEEQFDFPTLMIDLGDDNRRDLKVVR